MLGHVSLPVALHGELKAALVADEGLDAPVRSHVLLQQSLSQVSFVAELALEWPLPGVLVLPHVVEQVALGHELLLAYLALERLLALVLHPEDIQWMKLSENLDDLHQQVTILILSNYL